MKLYFLAFLFVISFNVSSQQVYCDGVLKSDGGMNHKGRRSKYWKHYKNGQIESEGWYSDGAKTGEWKYYLGTGKLDFIIRYSERQNNPKYKSGRWPWKGNGRYEGHEFPNKAAVIGYMMDGIMVGKVTFYYNDGIRIKEKGFYTNGLAAGDWQYFHKNGNLKEKGMYIEGMKFGAWEFYYEDGQIEKKGNFLRGVESGEWVFYYRNGQIKERRILPKKNVDKFRTGIVTQFYDSGELLLRGKYSLGKKNGKWTFFKRNGDIERVNEFIYGVNLKDLWGDSRALNENARKNYIEEINYENLLLGIKWVKRSIELDENYQNLETYAFLLAKIGKYLDALEIVEKAIILAKETQTDYTEIKKVILIAADLMQTKKSKKLDNYSLMKK